MDKTLHFGLLILINLSNQQIILCTLNKIIPHIWGWNMRYILIPQQQPSMSEVIMKKGYLSCHIMRAFTPSKITPEGWKWFLIKLCLLSTYNVFWYCSTQSLSLTSGYLWARTTARCHMLTSGATSGAAGQTFICRSFIFLLKHQHVSPSPEATAASLSSFPHSLSLVWRVTLRCSGCTI